MTLRQRILKLVYPLIMWWRKRAGKHITVPDNRESPPISFYSLKSQLNNGEWFDFSELKGKKVLLVNTASDCGYTNQYEALQKLSEANRDKLVVLGFPANDFKEQEKGTDEEIAQFCKKNFGISFPLMKKSSVIRSGEQHPVYQWLTDPSRNGWNSKQPSWNFAKYIVDEEGRLTNYFGAAISPLDKEFLSAI
jgi:glutathione peroxidase